MINKFKKIISIVLAIGSILIAGNFAIAASGAGTPGSGGIGTPSQWINKGGQLFTNPSNAVINVGGCNGCGGGSFSDISGTSTEIAYFDLAGKGTSDDLATRNPLTKETYIGYRTGAGQFTNALKLGNFVGTLIPDGTGFERHDSGISDSFVLSAAVDGTTIGGGTNTLIQGYVSQADNIFATGTYDENGAGLDYTNGLLGVVGSVYVFDNGFEAVYSDNGNTYIGRMLIEAGGVETQYNDQITGREMISVVQSDMVRFGNYSGFGNRMISELNDVDQYFRVSGLYNSSTNTYGEMLRLGADDGIMGMGDIEGINSHIGYFADDSVGEAYVNGFKKLNPVWTPTNLSDGFTGTGLNDLQYISTVTYSGPYPNSYNVGIATVGSVYVNIISITTPGFVTGDTVTDGAGSTGTIIGGSEVDGFFIIAPIIDSGWTSATSLSDISTGAAATVTGAAYTDTYSWSDTHGGSGAILPCLNFFVLNNGLQLGFTSPTGHTVGDSWDFTMTPGYTYSRIALFDGKNNLAILGDVDSEKNSTTIGVYDASKSIQLNSKGTVNIGAVNDVLTRLYVDVGNKIIQNYTEGTFKISDINGNKDVFITNPNTGFVHLGDNGLGNRTFIELDDVNQTITINNVQSYADDAAATGAGLVTGNVYKTTTGGSTYLKIVP